MFNLQKEKKVKFNSHWDHIRKDTRVKERARVSSVFSAYNVTLTDVYVGSVPYVITRKEKSTRIILAMVI